MSIRLKDQPKKQKEDMVRHSPAHRQSDSVRFERASIVSSSRDITTAFTVANSSRASYSRVGTPQAIVFWACPYLDEEAMMGLR
jgi:hypothetical protein